MAANKMKAIVWDGTDYPDCLIYRDFDVPELQPGWVLIRPLAVGVCGTDIHLVTGHTRYLVPDRNLPAVLGHEWAGEVVEVGDGVTGFQPGDRVGIEPILSCTVFGDSCPMCRIGKYNLCQKGLTHVGVPLTRMLPGGFGELSAVHHTRVFHLPDHVSYQEAALLDILGVAVHAVNLSNPHMGKTAAVLGCGVIGLDMLQCLRVEGITDIIAVARYENQAEAARELGAKEVVLIPSGGSPLEAVRRLTGGQGVDLVYECVGGMTDAVAQAVAISATAGSVVMLGGSSRPTPIDLQEMLLKEVNLLPSNSYSTHGRLREYQIGLDLLSNGQVNHSRLVTHCFSFDQYRQAFETALYKGREGALKVMFLRS